MDLRPGSPIPHRGLLPLSRGRQHALERSMVQGGHTALRTTSGREGEPVSSGTGFQSAARNQPIRRLDLLLTGAGKVMTRFSTFRSISHSKYARNAPVLRL